MQPQVYLFLHSCFCQCENKAAAAPVTAVASFKTCSTPTLQISPKLPLSFCLPCYSSALLCLLSFPFPFSHSPSVSAPLAPPTSIKFHLLGASCSYVVVHVYGFALYSVIKAPLCAQPRAAVFGVKGVPVGAPGPSWRGFGLCGYVIMCISLVSICLGCCFFGLIRGGCFRLKGEEAGQVLEGGFFPHRPDLPGLL